MFGKSFVYVIFQDGTDIYWARSRVNEYLNSVRGTLPEGVNPLIGPDATGVGWVFEYALVDDSGKHNLAQLRSLQDWNLRYALESVGRCCRSRFGRRIRQTIPDRSRSQQTCCLQRYSQRCRRCRPQEQHGCWREDSWRLPRLSFSSAGAGYIKSISDLEQIVVKAQNGVPIYVKNVGDSAFGT